MSNVINMFNLKKSKSDNGCRSIETKVHGGVGNRLKEQGLGIIPATGVIVKNGIA